MDSINITCNGELPQFHRIIDRLTASTPLLTLIHNVAIQNYISRHSTKGIVNNGTLTKIKNPIKAQAST
jgi:hypothetical protein